MPQPWERERHVAEAAIHRAAKLTKRVLSTVTEVAKHDASPVTVADFAAQALMTSVLRAAIPRDSAFVGEEDAEVLRRDAGLRERVYGLFAAAQADGGDAQASVEQMLDLIDLGGRGTGGSRGRFWVMDPVDGTAAFLRGEQYAVSLALVEDGKEVVGVVAYPNLKFDAAGRIRESSVDTHGLGIMLSAAAGHGASIISLPSLSSPLIPQALPQLDAPRRLADAHIVDCALNAPPSRAAVQQLAARLGAAFPGTDVWSSHVRYAALVVGGGDLLVRVPGRKSCVWDHAGAQLIYAEVGGRVTDLDGQAVDFGAGRHLSNNRGLLAAKRDIHEEILALAQEVMPKNS
ncbi:3'(2'),5'-bisphosphate nucleotidase [Tolypocladium ophioglossoides CBS 100239]|uniref:3'(2'),5'-bisphosphate nucleotidase n=1 Tax=Tolypocladium ophioglossoides (strain CBS 100239) TaxID=1163406 RepID=A0A0L0NLS6_TOLOC|nr:3'(2'),5'-bisphosphate nucleotidase [Tolypocladium ophioglossoides CBS 100239]